MHRCERCEHPQLGSDVGTGDVDEEELHSQRAQPSLDVTLEVQGNVETGDVDEAARNVLCLAR